MTQAGMGEARKRNTFKEMYLINFHEDRAEIYGKCTMLENGQVVLSLELDKMKTVPSLEQRFMDVGKQICDYYKERLHG